MGGGGHVLFVRANVRSIELRTSSHFYLGRQIRVHSPSTPMSKAALLVLTVCLRLGLGSYTIADLPHWGLSASEAELLGLTLGLR